MNGGNDNVLTLIVFMFLIAFGSIIFDWVSCEKKASIMQKECSFGILSGCMIKTENGFVPLESIRGVE